MSVCCDSAALELPVTRALSFFAERAAVAVVVTLSAVAGNVSAQSPAGGLAVTGFVHDSAGQPLGNVQVGIVGEQLSTRTDSSGRFALRRLPPGRDTLLFRRIGYRSARIPLEASMERDRHMDVVLRPVAHQLDRVVTEAPGPRGRRGRSSLRGSVTDSLGHPVDGADVWLLGAGLSTETDRSGEFEFRVLPAASFILRIRHVGFAPSTLAIQLADDDHRGTSVRLSSIRRLRTANDSARASGYGAPNLPFDEYDRRRRMNPTEVTVGPADLFRSEGSALASRLQRYRSSLSVESESDCILLDGRHALYEPLDSYAAVDVRLIEVLRPTDMDDGFVTSAMESIPECRSHAARHPTYFVLWTRSVR